MHRILLLLLRQVEDLLLIWSFWSLQLILTVLMVQVVTMHLWGMWFYPTMSTAVMMSRAMEGLEVALALLSIGSVLACLCLC